LIAASTLTYLLIDNFNNAAFIKVNAMTPEEEARQEIDRLLEAASWQVQDYKDLNLGAALEQFKSIYSELAIKGDQCQDIQILLATNGVTIID
jgi:hypothetical protein